MIYTTEVFQPQDLQFDKYYQDMVRQTGEQVPANGSMHPQLIMDIDAVNATLPVRPGFELADPVLLELVQECSRAERGQRPMIDAPHALLSKVDRGHRVCVVDTLVVVVVVVIVVVVVVVVFRVCVCACVRVYVCWLSSWLLLLVVVVFFSREIIPVGC